MLYYTWLSLLTIVCSYFKPKIQLTDSITLRFRAGLFHTDYNLHLNGGRYFSYSDRGRWEFAVRSGLFSYILKRNIVILIAGQKIIYRREIPALGRFQVDMQIVGWDDEWIYVTHIFRQGKNLKATSAAKLGLITKGQRLSPKTELAIWGYPTSPTLPIWVAHWFQDDKVAIDRSEGLIRNLPL